MITVSVIVPAFNEEATIIEILESVARQRIDGFAFEVLVVDDGSTDNTVHRLESRPELYTKLIRMPVNGGKGAAVKAGLHAATGDYILFQDADLEYDPDEYRRLLLPVRRFDADLVIGSRVVAVEYTRVLYFWHKVGNWFISTIFNILHNTTFTDIYSCFVVYRRRLVDPDRLKTRGWEQQAEILSHIVKRGKNLYEVPINYRGRTVEEGKKIRPHHVIPVLWTIIFRRFMP